MHLRPTYSGVVSTLALAVALSGTAYAAATLTGADVKDGSLTGRDVRNNSITSNDVRELTKKDLRPGVLPQPGPGARMEASGALTVPGGPDNSFEMDTEAFDTGGMYTAPDDFLTVTRTGTYLVTGVVHYGQSSAQRQLRIVVDGDVAALVTDSGADTQRTAQVTSLLRLTTGQRLTLGTFSGNAVAVVDFNGANDAWLAAQWMAP